MAYVVSRGGSRLAARPEGFGPMEPQMRTSELKQLCAMTRRLPPSQREELMAHLTEDVVRDEVGAVIQGKRARHPGCPKCGGQHTVRNGQAGGLQRCKCRGCGATFNALTGTPGASASARQVV